MPKRSKLALLPESVREYVRATLISRSFSQYDALFAEVRELGRKLGVPPEDLPSKTALHNFGSDLEHRLQAVKAATEAAASIVAAAPDDEASLSTAVIGMIQTDIFNIIVKLREADDADPVNRAKLLAKVAKDVATLTRAEVNLKRYRTEVREKVKSAADAVAKIASKGGMSKALVAEMRNRILGVAS